MYLRRKMMNKEDIIKELIELNFSMCQNSMEVNDGVIYDLLMYGFKGYNNMSIEELQKELDDLKEADEEDEDD
jgi:hypothetical protein